MQLGMAEDVVPVKVVQDAVFSSLGTLRYQTPEMLTYVVSKQWLPMLRRHPSASAVFCPPDLVQQMPSHLGIVESPEPNRDFFLFHNHLAECTHFYQQPCANKIHPTCHIDSTATIAEHNVKIGKDAVIGPRAVVVAGSVLGQGVVLEPGVVVGASGFEFRKTRQGVLSIQHGGGVHLADNVSVLANTHIARAVFNANTCVGAETKIDALVNISHHVVIGKRCLIAANASVAGSAMLGNDVWVGPGATISSFVRIGDGAHVSLGSVVTSDVPSGKKVTGIFAADHDKFMGWYYEQFVKP